MGRGQDKSTDLYNNRPNWDSTQWRHKGVEAALYSVWESTQHSVYVKEYNGKWYLFSAGICITQRGGRPFVFKNVFNAMIKADAIAKERRL